MNAFQELIIIGAIICVTYALLVTGFLSWSLFVKRRTLFNQMDSQFQDQLDRVQTKLKKKE